MIAIKILATFAVFGAVYSAGDEPYYESDYPPTPAFKAAYALTNTPESNLVLYQGVNGIVTALAFSPNYLGEDYIAGGLFYAVGKSLLGFRNVNGRTIPLINDANREAKEDPPTDPKETIIRLISALGQAFIVGFTLLGPLSTGFINGLAAIFTGFNQGFTNLALNPTSTDPYRLQFIGRAIAAGLIIIGDAIDAFLSAGYFFFLTFGYEYFDLLVLLGGAKLSNLYNGNVNFFHQINFKSAEAKGDILLAAARALGVPQDV